MRIEVLGAFGETQADGTAKCFHPPSIPYPDGSKPKRFLETGVDLREETAEWAIKVGAAKPVFSSAQAPSQTAAESEPEPEATPAKKGKAAKAEPKPEESEP